MIDRKKIRDKYDGACAYCGATLGDRFHIDHFIPKHKGGEDYDSNLMPSCQRCNLWKGGYTIEEFREEIFMQVDRLMRDSPGFRIARDFNLIITPGRQEVKFYYEVV